MTKANKSLDWNRGIGEADTEEVFSMATVCAPSDCLGEILRKMRDGQIVTDEELRSVVHARYGCGDMSAGAFWHTPRRFLSGRTPLEALPGNGDLICHLILRDLHGSARA